jgi:hypothetical protein
MSDVKHAPDTFWAITRFDPKIGEKRIIDIYANPEDAQVDATMLGSSFVEVEPFLIHNAPQYVDNEPAIEENAADFDTPIHVTGEVR